MLRLQPHQLSYRGNKTSPQLGDSFVSITDLENVNFQSPRNSVLLAQILCYKLAEKNPDDRPKMYNRGHKAVVYNYERMMKLRCINAPDGVNVFNILLSKHRNCHLFDFYLELRDEGYFSPGSIVSIHRPKRVMSWLGSNEPLLDVPSAFYCVEPSCLSLPQALISHTAERTHSFHYKNARISIDSVDVIDCNCKGSFCAALDLWKDGIIAPVCPCFSATKRTSGVTLLWSFRFHVDDCSGRTITHQVSSFTSSEFMKRFLSHDLIPPGLTASMITENETLYRQLIDNLYDGIEEVNESGGFEISGWLRKGFSIDQASKDSSKVKSSESILHLTFIDFPSAIVSNHLNDLYAYLQSGPVLSTQDGNLNKMSETGEIEESDGVDH